MRVGPTLAGLSIDFGQITERIPRALVERILEETKKGSVRVRKLPAYLMVYYTIAAGLISSPSCREVLRLLLSGVQDELLNSKVIVASRAAIGKARQRLGAAPIRELFEAVARPIAKRTTRGPGSGAFDW